MSMKGSKVQIRCPYMHDLLKRNYIYNSGIKDPTGGSTDKAAIERMRKQARLKGEVNSLMKGGVAIA